MTFDDVTEQEISKCIRIIVSPLPTNFMESTALAFFVTECRGVKFYDFKRRHLEFGIHRRSSKQLTSALMNLILISKRGLAPCAHSARARARAVV